MGVNDWLEREDEKAEVRWNEKDGGRQEREMKRPK